MRWWPREAWGPKKKANPVIWVAVAAVYALALVLAAVLLRAARKLRQ